MQTKEKRYVSALVNRGNITCEPAIVLALYGNRGGTVSTAEMTVSEAERLRDQLNAAITELTAVMQHYA